jgi:hypothetical protein
MTENTELKVFENGTGIEVLSDQDKADLAFITHELEAHNWKFAKSMPQWPHYYTLRKDWDYALFMQVVTILWRLSYPDPFLKKVYHAININGWKYWTMDPTIATTDLINRKDANSAPVDKLQAADVMPTIKHYRHRA